MTRSLLLHIGTTKTGSTSIQHLLHTRREALIAHGVYYPETQSDTKHLLMAAMFSSYPNIVRDVGVLMWHGKDPLTVLADYRAAFRGEMQRLPSRLERVIMSAEQFSQFVRQPNDLTGLRRFLSEFFDDIQIFVYIRRQDSHYASSYAQSLRMGKIHLPDLRELREYYHDYDYADLLDRWARVFGPEAIRPRIFEGGAGSRFDVVDDFCQACDLHLPAADAPAKTQRNLSMNLVGQKIFLECGMLLQAQKQRKSVGGAVWQRVSKAVSGALPGPGWQPTCTQAAVFMTQFADSNEAARERWFPDRERLFSNDYSNLPEVEAPIDGEDAFKAACAVILDVATNSALRDQQASMAKFHRASKDHKPKAQRAALLRAVALNEADIGARLQLARLQISEGALIAAQHNINEALKLDPRSELAGMLQRRAGRLARKSATAAEAEA